ncbi:MAG TPA: MarR family winged helix-turn-helix transcriptional regulator [Polyangiaceae bacterium]|jgi:DNA-binding MarR family transcriptional regulator
MDGLRRIVRDLRLSARDAERSAGISGAQLFVLQALTDESASSLNELADRTLTDQSSVSVVVKRLADQKLVARKPSAVDARRIELSLTAAGRRLLARCPEPTQARLVTALRRLAAGELASLTAGIGALVRGMGIEDDAPRMLFDDEVAGGGRRSRVASRIGGEPSRRRNPRGAA